ncbi:MAG: hypothetical protein E6K49_14825 [Gammaproteobacteria bacterium]|nr:MAG: hypothetical protein E6K49_14825 [Gammaproteobacteria bacterium]
MTIDTVFRRAAGPTRAAAMLAAPAVAIVCGLAAAQDLSGLPDYRPRQPISGVIRSSGNEQMGTLMKYWQEGFRKYHPEARFADSLKGTASGIYGLEMRTADIAVMGRAMNPFERYGTYERSWMYPVEIEVATGSFATDHKSPAFAILVHQDNPLSKLTVKQLDGIFGAQRGGGWKALSWDENAARSSAQNIRTWDQLGLKGRWAGRPHILSGQSFRRRCHVERGPARVRGSGPHDRRSGQGSVRHRLCRAQLRERRSQTGFSGGQRGRTFRADDTGERHGSQLSAVASGLHRLHDRQ